MTWLTNLTSKQGYSVTGEMSRERTTTRLDDRADVTTSSHPTPRHLHRRRCRQSAIISATPARSSTLSGLRAGERPRGSCSSGTSVRMKVQIQRLKPENRA